MVKDSRGKTKKMSKFEAMVQNTLTSAIKGEPRARKTIIDLAKMIGFLIPPPIPEAEQQNGVIIVPATLSVEEWIEKYGKPVPDSAMDPFDEEEDS